jgi:hypothetical protein
VAEHGLIAAHTYLSDMPLPGEAQWKNLGISLCEKCSIFWLVTPKDFNDMLNFQIDVL